MGIDDFGSLTGGLQKGAVQPVMDKGTKRVWLKVFETMPPQMLNAYGQAKFPKMSDSQVWHHLCQPLKSGALSMTELTHLSDERRGIGINRFLHAQKLYLEYQDQEDVKRSNEFLIKEPMYSEFYAESARILPSIAYCLAPKKVYEKQGASSLRQSASEQASSGGIVRSTEDLDKHGKIVYDWLNNQVRSRIRMLQSWQSAGGQSYVSSVHHRGVTCFRYYGNTEHKENDPTVSLSEFQAAIKIRHQLGSSGIAEEANSVAGPSIDFEGTGKGGG